MKPLPTSSKLCDLEKKVLFTACSKITAHPNIASLHYDWTGGKQTNVARRLWHGPIRAMVKAGLIKVSVDHWTPMIRNPNLYVGSYEELRTVDFRRRIHFSATRLGWGLFHRMKKKGGPPPAKAPPSGHWVEEDVKTGNIRHIDRDGYVIKGGD